MSPALPRAAAVAAAASLLLTAFAPALPALAAADQDVLAGIAVLSASSAWAVGYQGRFQTLIEHWNGTRWKVGPSPN